MKIALELAEVVMLRRSTPSDLLTASLALPAYGTAPINLG
jgi:hypothetical protein